MSDVGPGVMASVVSGEGRDGRYCGARKRQGEGTCTQAAGWGTSHPGEGRCKLHGGSTSDQTKHVLRGRARMAVEKAGDLRDVDPHTVLLEEVQRSAGMVALLEVQLDSVTDGDEKAGVMFEWRSERDRSVRASRVAIDCGVEVKRVELEKARVAMQADGVRAGMDAVNMPDDQRVVFVKAMTAKLRIEGEGS